MPRIRAAAALVSLLAGPLVAQTVGALDPSFGLNGRASYDLGLAGSREDLVFAVAGDDAGGVVAVGTSAEATGYQAFVVRYLDNGDLDPGFGFYWGSTNADQEVFTDVARIPGSGDLLVAGWDLEALSDYVVLLRVDANGNLVVSGRTYVDTLSSHVKVGVQRNGRILLAWSDLGFQSNMDFVVCRFLDPTTIDLSFGSQGCRRVAFDLGAGAAGDDRLGAFAVLPDDRILLAGQTAAFDATTLVARLLPDGDPDPSFGVAGRASMDLAAGHDERVFDAAVLDDGSSLLAGWDWAANGSRSALVRVAPDGSSHQVSHPGDHGVAATLIGVVVQGDGKVVVAGASLQGQAYFVRLLPGGGPDPDFGSGGESHFLLDPTETSTDAAFLGLDLSAGRPVAGGYVVRTPDPGDSTLARVTSDYVFADGFERGSLRAWSAWAP